MDESSCVPEDMSFQALSSSSLLTRHTLLFRLRDWDDRPSWEEFYRMYRRLVYGLACRSGLSHSEAEDIVQDVFRHVAEKILDFESRPHRGAFRRWLMNQARWRITDRFRERRRAAGTGGADPGSPMQTHDVEQLPGPDSTNVEAMWELEWQQHVLHTALERLARRAPAKHFQAFDLCSRQGWEPRQVADELGLTVAAVYMHNHRLTKQLKAEVKRIQRTAG